MKLITTVTSLLVVSISTLASASPMLLNKRALGFDYGSEKVQGVNLGGWFVLEPYITPSLFECFDPNNTPVDEYHYCQALGKQEAKNRLEDHWSSWITESDFAEMAGWGINHVRIPIGYWAFQPLSNDPYVTGQVKYLDKAIQWAKNNNLKVWVDLHGAPGSQNGFDNSGLRDQTEWQNGNNVQATYTALQKLIDRYGDMSDVVTGIELLNEPLGPVLNMDRVKDFFTKGYEMVRKKGDDTAVVIHDAFQQTGYWNNFMNAPQYNNVILDHHQYQVFSHDELKRSIDEHVQTTCSIGRGYQQEAHWRITGEWSAALTDCTKWLNGVGRGARYSGDYDNSDYIGSCAGTDQIDTWSDDRKQNTRKYIEAQLDAYNQGDGWVFWCYKCENSLEWSMKDLIKNNLFPQPFDSRHYQNQCGF